MSALFLLATSDVPFAEPPTTRHLSDEDIQSLIHTCSKPDIPDLPSHSQGVERSVKLVTEAAHAVFGYENRHRCIITKLLSRRNLNALISELKCLF